MSPAPTLTPPLALDYLRELSADIVSGVVLDRAGNLLAGPDDLGEAARDLMNAAARRRGGARQHGRRRDLRRALGQARARRRLRARSRCRR